MIFSINATNRDPAVYANPHGFDLTRQEQATLSFGQGPHSCAGTWLALAEMTTALTALPTRLPGLRPQPGTAARVTAGGGARRGAAGTGAGTPSPGAPNGSARWRSLSRAARSIGVTLAAT